MLTLESIRLISVKTMWIKSVGVFIVFRIFVNCKRQEHQQIPFFDLEKISNSFNFYKFTNLDSSYFAIMISLAHEHQKGKEALRFFDASIDKLDFFEFIVAQVVVFYQVVDIILFYDQNLLFIFFYAFFHSMTRSCTLGVFERANSKNDITVAVVSCPASWNRRAWATISS